MSGPGEQVTPAVGPVTASPVEDAHAIIDQHSATGGGELVCCHRPGVCGTLEWAYRVLPARRPRREEPS